MDRILRVGAIALAALVGIFVVVNAALYALGTRNIHRKYDVTPEAIAIPTDSAAIARGEHLVRNVTSCTLCHGADLGGHVYAEMGPLGTVAGPNLTRGQGGIGAAFTDADWLRALRHGVRSDGTSLIAMPSEVFVHLSDSDIASIIAYVRQVPPVDREAPRSRFGPVGRVMLGAGKLGILVAPKTKAFDAPPSPPIEGTREYGKYLADVAGCHGCHGFGLSGGRVAGPPDVPPASNLTPSGMGSWTEGDFVRVMRTGTRPGGSRINDFMPWTVFKGMTDAELHSLWLYLQSVPARPFGNK